MRAFLILLSALMLSASAAAQDLLVKQNGEKMRVKVLKITKKKVEFVRFGTELPVYSLPISDIAYIEYPLGDRDTFGRNVAPATTPAKEPEKWHGAVPTPDGRVSVDVNEVVADQKVQEPKRWHGAVAPHTDKSNELIVAPEEKREVIYEIGDIYDRNGVKGIVVMTQNDGRNGIIMSVDEVCLAWSTLKRKQLKKMGATNSQDGEQNMAAIERYIAENGLSWKDFPAFEWCKAKGDGWYLPSINELKTIYEHRDILSKCCEEHKGECLLKRWDYWSSSKNAEDKVISINMLSGRVNYTHEQSTLYLVRPIAKFNY